MLIFFRGGGDESRLHASGCRPSLCKGDFSAWALGLHTTVAEVATALATVRMIGAPGGQWGLQDAAGQSIVVECVTTKHQINTKS